MITHSSGSLGAASDSVSEPAADALDPLAVDFGADSSSFTGGGLPPNNPNDTKNNPIQRSSQTLHKVNQSAQRQKVVQSIQRKYGNSIAARLVANYNNSTNATIPRPKPTAQSVTRVQSTNVGPASTLTRLHISTRPGVINRACCKQCEEQEKEQPQQVQRSFEPNQPVATTSQFVDEAELAPIVFPAGANQSDVLKNGELPAQPLTTNKPLPATFSKKDLIANKQTTKRAKAGPSQVATETVEPEQPQSKVEVVGGSTGATNPNQAQDQLPPPAGGVQLFAATFKQARQTVAPFQQEENLKWQKALSAHPELTSSTQKSLRIPPAVAHPAPVATGQLPQLANPVIDQNKNVAEKTLQSSRTMLGQLGTVGAFFLPDRKEFVNNSLTDAIPDGLPIMRTAQPGAKTGLEMEKIANKERQRRQQVEAMVSQFLAANSGKGQEILNVACEIPGQISSAANTAKGQLSGALGQTLGSINQQFETAKNQVTAQSQTALQAIAQQHSQALSKIQAATAKASQYLVTARQAATTELQAKISKEEEVFNQTYAKWQPKYKEEGDKVGQEASQIAENKAKQYESQKINRDDNIFDGPLTDNRMEARAKAARQVGESYQKSMQEEGTKQAAKMIEGKAKDVENLKKEVGEQVNKTLDECVTKANEDIKKAETEIIKAAQDAQTKLIEAVNANTTKIQAQLSQAQQSTTEQAHKIADQLNQQIDQTANGSIQAISQSANTAAQKVSQTLAQFSQSLRGSTAPDEAAMNTALAQAGGQINAMVAEVTGKLMQSGSEVAQGLGKLAGQGATNLGQVEQQAAEQAQALLEAMQGLVSELIQAATETYSEVTKAHEENATKRSEFIQEQYKEVFKALDECFAKVNTEMEQGFGKSVQEFGQALRDYMNGSSADALLTLIEKNAEEAASKVEPRWLTVLKIIVAIVVSIVVAVVLGPAVIGAIGAFAGVLGASAAVAGAIGAVVGGAIVGAIGGALSQLANNVISNIAGFKTDLLDGVLESFISGAVGGALGGAGGLLIKAGDSFLKSFAVEVGSDILGGLVGDNVANLALGKPLDFNLSPMDVALSVLTTGLTNDKVMNKVPGLENFQNKGMEFGQNFGTKVGSSFRPDFKVSTPALAIKSPEIKGVTTKDVGTVTTRGVSDKGLDVSNISSSKLGELDPPKLSDVGKSSPPVSDSTPTKVGDSSTPATKPDSTDSPGGKKNQTKEYLHGDVPEIENFVVAKLPTTDGHNLKVLKDGRIAKCSECGVLSAVYGVELAMAPRLKAELEAAKVQTDVNAKVAAAKKIEEQLRTIQDTKLILQGRGVDPTRIDNFIRKLDGNNPQDITVIMDFVARHGLHNAVTNLTFNNLHVPAQPITTVSTSDGAFTALASEVLARPNGEAPSGTPAANPPVKNFGETLLKLKTEALEALQKRMVRSTLRKLPMKDWLDKLNQLDNTAQDADGKTELDKALERLGLENGMPGMIQLQGRAEMLLRSMLDVEKVDARQFIKLESYFTAKDIDMALARQVGDKLANIDPASHAGLDLIKKIKQDFYKNHLVGVTGKAVAFKKFLRNLGLSSSSFNAKYKQDKLNLRNKVEEIFNNALDSKQTNPLTPEDIEFLSLSQTDKDQLDAMKDSVHSNLQKLSVALSPLLAQAGSKAKVEGYVRIPIPDSSGVGMGFVGMRITLQGEHDVYFFENKPPDNFEATKEENAQTKKDLRNEKKAELGPVGIITTKVGDGLGKKPEGSYKFRAEIALTGGYQALDVTKTFKKLFDGGAEGGFYIEAESNVNIQRGLELISFGIQRKLLEQKGIRTDWVADMVWGKADAPTTPPANRSPLNKAKDWFSPQKWKDWHSSKQRSGRKWNEDFLKTFTSDEYVEAGGFGNAFGSFSPIKFKGNVKQSFGKRYHKNTMQALKDLKGITDLAPTGRQKNIGRKIRTTEVGVEFGASSFAFGGKFRMGVMPGQINPTQLAAVDQRVQDTKTELANAKTEMENAKTAFDADTTDAGLKQDYDDATTAYNDKKTEYDNLVLQQKLLPAHLFDLSGEVSAASKGGEWANGDPAALAAAITNAVGNFAAQFKGFVTHNKSQYSKDRGADHLYSSALTSLPAVIDEAILNRVTSTTNSWAVNSMSGLKISFKVGSKQDFALAGNSGLWYEPKIGAAPFRFEVSVEQIGNLGGDTILGGGSIEKTSLIFRLGFKYKQGNWLMVDDSVVDRVIPTLANPHATATNQLPPPAPLVPPAASVVPVAGSAGTTPTLPVPNPNPGAASSSSMPGAVTNLNPVNPTLVTTPQPALTPILTTPNPVLTPAVNPFTLPLPPSPTTPTNSTSSSSPTSPGTPQQPGLPAVVTAQNPVPVTPLDPLTLPLPPSPTTPTNSTSSSNPASSVVQQPIQNMTVTNQPEQPTDDDDFGQALTALFENDSKAN